MLKNGTGANRKYYLPTYSLKFYLSSGCSVEIKRSATADAASHLASLMGRLRLVIPIFLKFCCVRLRIKEGKNTPRTLLICVVTVQLT